MVQAPSTIRELLALKRMGFPYGRVRLRNSAPNGNVAVYDARTGNLKRIEPDPFTLDMEVEVLIHTGRY